MAYVNKKAKLHTPEGVTPAYNIFPLVVLDGIYDGLNNAGTAAYKIIYTDQNDPRYNKIKEQYLSIVGSTTTTVNNVATTSFFVKPEYLQMLDPQEVVVSGTTYTNWYVKHDYLDILENGKIASQYLPSYVDDVIEVVVFSGEDWPTSGTICIRQETDSSDNVVYRFYTKVGNSWQAGGGESSKIYMDVSHEDSAIYRCATNNDQYAYRIDENPYVIDGSTTNGVYLEQNGSTLKAKAVVASASQYGTIKVTAGTTNGVTVSITDGVLAVGGILSNGLVPGTVVTVGSTASIANFKDNGYVTANIVPTADWMISYVAEQISTIRPVVAHASTEDYGIVRIDPLGHINVSDGVIGVPVAGGTTAGVVVITGSSASITGGESQYSGMPLTVTPKAVKDYVVGVLVGYQQTLIPGNGISIVSNAISVKVSGPVTFDNGSVTVPNATDVTSGVVCITDASTDITAEKSQTTGGTPLAVTPNAVHDYTTTAIQGATNAIVTNIQDGTLHGPQITASAAMEVPDNYTKLATVGAISSYVAGKIGDMQHPIAAGVGVSVTQGQDTDKVSVLYGGAITTSTVTGGTAIVVPAAGSATSGAVLIQAIEDANSATMDTTTNKVANALDVRNWVSGRITDNNMLISQGTVHGPQITTKDGFSDLSVNSSALATVSAISGFVDDKIATKQRPISGGVGITITPGTTNDTVSVNYGGAITASGSAIVVANATWDATGAGVARHIADAGSADGAHQFAQAYDVQQYVSSQVSNKQKTIVAGVGLSKTYDSEYPNQETLDVVYTGAITTSGDALTVSKATTGALGVVQIGDGLTVTNGGVVSITPVSAAYVDTSAGSQFGGADVPLGYVRVWNSGGIQVSNGVLALKEATGTTFGGVKLHSSTGLSLNDNKQLQLATTAPLKIANSSLQIDYATDTTSGAVTMIKGATVMTAINDDGKVPTGAAVSTFVTSKIANAAEAKLNPGDGISITPVSEGGVLVSKNIAVNYGTPGLAISGGALIVQTAQGDQTTALANSAFGAVWVRTEIRSSATIAADGAKLSTVPTEQAVRTLMDTTVGSLRYLEYDIVED